MLTSYIPAADEIVLPALLIGGVHAYYRRARPLTNHTSRSGAGGLIICIQVQVIPYADAEFTAPWPIGNWPAPVTISTDANTAVDPENGNILFVYQGMQNVLNTTTFATEIIPEDQDWPAWLAASPDSYQLQTLYYRAKYDAGTVDMRAEEIHHIQQAAAWGRLD